MYTKMLGSTTSSVGLAGGVRPASPALRPALTNRRAGPQALLPPRLPRLTTTTPPASSAGGAGGAGDESPLPGHDASGRAMAGSGPNPAETTSPGLPRGTPTPVITTGPGGAPSAHVGVAGSRRMFHEAAEQDMSPPAEVGGPILTGAGLLAGLMAGGDEELPGDEAPPQYNVVFDPERMRDSGDEQQQIAQAAPLLPTPTLTDPHHLPAPHTHRNTSITLHAPVTHVDAHATAVHSNHHQHHHHVQRLVAHVHAHVDADVDVTADPWVPAAAAAGGGGGGGDSAVVVAADVGRGGHVVVGPCSLLRAPGEEEDEQALHGSGTAGAYCDPGDPWVRPGAVQATHVMWPDPSLAPLPPQHTTAHTHSHHPLYQPAVPATAYGEDEEVVMNGCRLDDLGYGSASGSMHAAADDLLSAQHRGRFLDVGGSDMQQHLQRTSDVETASASWLHEGLECDCDADGSSGPCACQECGCGSMHAHGEAVAWVSGYLASAAAGSTRMHGRGSLHPLTPPNTPRHALCW